MSGGGMLEVIFGNKTVEKVLFYLYVYESGYIREIAANYGEPPNGIRQQLIRLEAGSVISGTLRGKIRLYQFNPKYPFLDELKALLKKAYEALPEKDLERYFRKRNRQKRTGKL